MLVALSATEAVGWEDLEAKVSELPHLDSADRLSVNQYPSLSGERVDRALVPTCQ